MTPAPAATAANNALATDRQVSSDTVASGIQRAGEIETDLDGELEQIRARIDADRPDPGPVELDAEIEARPPPAAAMLTTAAVH